MPVNGVPMPARSGTASARRSCVAVRCTTARGWPGRRASRTASSSVPRLTTNVWRSVRAVLRARAWTRRRCELVHAGPGARPGGGQEPVQLAASQGADLGPEPFVGHRAERGDLSDSGIGDLVGDGVDAGLEADQDVLGNLVHADRLLGAVLTGRP